MQVPQLNGDDYEILQYVASGGYGTVFRARSRAEPTQLVALKFFDYSSAPNHSRADWVQREIDQMALLTVGIEGTCSMIGTFNDTAQGRVDGVPYTDAEQQRRVLRKYRSRPVPTLPVIVMELLHGAELYDKVLAKAEEGGFTERDAAAVLACVCNTFAQIHARRIVIRDFKLENCVFVHADPARLDCKIIEA